MNQVPIAVFASGGGSNFQALIDYEGNSSYHIVLLLTDRKQAGAIERAEKAGKHSEVVDQKGKSDQEVTNQMKDLLESYEVEFIALAGYLRKIPPAVVSLYTGRMVNIHPALLPRFGGEGMYGRSVHKAVIEAGETISGPTVHYVDEDYDTGEIIAQALVPILEGDDPDSLSDKVLQAEHQLYPRTVHQLCSSLR
jgi:phosphoribosylglycinamide formyltransferase-1